MSENAPKIAIFTIGHSNLDIKKFLNTLNSNKIKLLVDVRSKPFSSYSPQFNMKHIKAKLENSGIEYKFMGKDIGGKPEDGMYYNDGKVIYELIRESDRYKKGICKLIKLASQKKTVVMCSEENPYKCHRHNLIAQTLLDKNIEVFHIKGNNTIEKAKKNGVQLTFA